MSILFRINKQARGIKFYFSLKFYKAHNCTLLSFEVSYSTVDELLKHSSYLNSALWKISTLFPFDPSTQNSIIEYKVDLKSIKLLCTP